MSTGTALVELDVAPASSGDVVAAPVLSAATVVPWPATCLPLSDAVARAGDVLACANKAMVKTRHDGSELLLRWLATHPGDTWQQRWVASGVEAAGGSWRHELDPWARQQRLSPGRVESMLACLSLLFAADLIRPGLSWLIQAAVGRGGLLVRAIESARDPNGFNAIRDRIDASGLSTPEATRVVYRIAILVAHHGGPIAALSVADLDTLFSVEDEQLVNPAGGRASLYRILREIGTFGPDAPTRYRAIHTKRQRTPEQMIDRFGIACAPIRDLLVDYLRERQPALDYASLESLSHMLGKLFWADLERANPGIASLSLPAQVARDWKQRLRSITKTVTDTDGTTGTVTVARTNYRECLTPVRAFYLDLAHWAVEDPARWGPWVARCPVGDEEVNRRKAIQHRKSRMDTRTRQRLPELPALARHAQQRRQDASELLTAAVATPPRQHLTSPDGTVLIRRAVGRGSDRVWVQEASSGVRRDLTREEDHAFWAWAIIEVLRHTGVRIEELLELSHHSLVQYRLPRTGELVPLLQIVPSKTDAERLLLVSPELADVLASIIARIRQPGGMVPMVSAYDGRERCWSPPSPLLFQRRVGSENRCISTTVVHKLLTDTLACSTLVDTASGQPLRFTPHDFRRMFITDAILTGLPPHIAQVIAGHRDINVTMGYKAVYPIEAIQAHQAFLARRRGQRPSQEYRTPTDEEWEAFLGHFERRKVATGTCGRAFGTPCIHEHACIRCPMLWPDPTQRDRLVEIRDSLDARITEAEREGWLGELEGLRISLTGTQDKLAQLERRRPTPIPLNTPQARP